MRETAFETALKSFISSAFDDDGDYVDFMGVLVPRNDNLERVHYANKIISLCGM
jgi:hypothetical protein